MRGGDADYDTCCVERDHFHRESEGSDMEALMTNKTRARNAMGGFSYEERVLENLLDSWTERLEYVDGV